MTAHKPNFNIDTLYLARKDELSEGERYGYLRAMADMQPRVDALVAALQAVYADVDLANVPGGSEELNGMVCAALKPTEGPPTP